jgi:hypothetical protein
MMNWLKLMINRTQANEHLQLQSNIVNGIINLLEVIYDSQIKGTDLEIMNDIW